VQRGKKKVSDKTNREKLFAEMVLFPSLRSRDCRSDRGAASGELRRASSRLTEKKKNNNLLVKWFTRSRPRKGEEREGRGQRAGHARGREQE